MYGKIFESMYGGSLYGHWEALVTMQQLIVLSDPHGEIDLTPEAIAARTSIPLEIISAGLKELSEPDPRSRSRTDDGRRITLIDPSRDWGWKLVNHDYYNGLVSACDKREKDKIAIGIKRKSLKDNGVAKCRKVSQSVVNVAHVDVDVDVNADANRNPPVTPLPEAGDSPIGKPKTKTTEAKMATFKPIEIQDYATIHDPSFDAIALALSVTGEQPEPITVGFLKKSLVKLGDKGFRTSVAELWGEMKSDRIDRPGAILVNKLKSAMKEIA